MLPAPLPVILSTALTVLLTGAFHEDGLADTFDGLGGGATRERALEIMKDSRIGTFGVAALVLTLLIKIAALSALPVDVRDCGADCWTCVLASLRDDAVVRWQPRWQSRAVASEERLRRR